MKLYSFLIKKEPRHLLSELITYLEKKYKLKYLEAINFSMNSSFNFINFQIFGSNFSYHEVFFQVTKNSKEILKNCPKCNFPFSEEDLEEFPNGKKECRNCNYPYKN